MGWLQRLSAASLLGLVPQVSGLLAFPGAEGFGRNAIGGRTGSVYHVTNLKYVYVISSWAYIGKGISADKGDNYSDVGTGSFRDAVSGSNRIVVFDVGGTINITDRVVVSSKHVLSYPPFLRRNALRLYALHVLEMPNALF